MTQLYLIRHGEAIGATEHIIGDTPLSPFGRKQAAHLRDRLAATKEIKADVLISSTLLRAKETAEIIAPAFGLPIIFDDEVQELRVGELEGMRDENARAKFGEPDFEHHPFSQLVPGAESWAQFNYRICSALDRITNQYEGKTSVVVCHGGVIDGSFLYFFGLSTIRLPSVHFYTQNTAITHWQKSSYDGGSKWRLVKYNDIMHLRDIDSSVSIPWKELAAKPVSADQPAVPIPTEKTHQDARKGRPH